MNSKQLFELALSIDERLTMRVNEQPMRGRMNVQKYLRTLRAICERRFVQKFDERGKVGYYVFA